MSVSEKPEERDVTFFSWKMTAMSVRMFFFFFRSDVALCWCKGDRRTGRGIGVSVLGADFRLGVVCCSFPVCIRIILMDTVYRVTSKVIYRYLYVCVTCVLSDHSSSSSWSVH